MEIITLIGVFIWTAFWIILSCNSGSTSPKGRHIRYETFKEIKQRKKAYKEYNRPDITKVEGEDIRVTELKNLMKGN